MPLAASPSGIPWESDVFILFGLDDLFEMKLGQRTIALPQLPWFYWI